MLKRWVQGIEGTTAVEFSFVALPFVIMIIGTIEMAMMFATQSLLEASTATAARLIRTGQVQQSGGNPEDMFQDALCDFAAVLIPCGDIQYLVQDLPDFGSADDFPPPEFDEEGNMEDQGFSPGDVNDVVMIRVAYRYPIMTPMMQPVLTNTGGDERLMFSTVVLRTEPYDFTGEEE